jgi:hypothetical protein
VSGVTPRPLSLALAYVESCACNEVAPDVRGAYADPPYIGQSKKHYGDHPDYAGEVDHEELIWTLQRHYDCWALSLSVPSLHIVLDHCRDQGLSLMDGDVRLLSWVKPFAAFKRNVRVAYTWEPLIVKVAPRLEGAIPTRDHIAEPITMKRGLTGAKPERVCHWLFAVMGLRRTDSFVDLYPGSGAVARAWETWTQQLDVAA